MLDKSILVVEDNDMILMMLERILNREYKVFTAQSCKKAKEIYEQNHPDMILVDYEMPKMNGFEMIDLLREKYGSGISTIFLTTSEQEEAELEEYGHGSLAFLRKPVKAEKLLTTIRACMDKK